VCSKPNEIEPTQHIDP